MKILIATIIISAGWINSLAQMPLKIAKLKYQGGGDWYANKTALPNLIAFCNKELGMNMATEEDVAEVGSPNLYD